MTPQEFRVLDAYEKSLCVPKEKPSRLSILCPVGLVGAGKTTVVKPLSERLGYIRISGDDVRKALKDAGLGYEKTFDIAAALAEKYLKLGYSIATDSDCASEHTVKLIERAQKEFGATPIWIHVNPPEDFIVNKLRNFKHTWLFKDGDDAVANYMRRKPLHENLPMPFLYTFDTSRADLGNQLDQAEAAIRKALQ